MLRLYDYTLSSTNGASPGSANDINPAPYDNAGTTGTIENYE